ncbi:MAG: hypothetical protein K6E53_12975 [Lachnospiraceae bacterium]|nr:hypothetical protein [Lachnospiraceae bacterium]
MSKIDSNMSGYLHTYEAYRVPKGTKVQDATGKEVVLSNEEDVLVLTEKASKQLAKDRGEHTGMLQQKAEMAAQKTQDAANEKICISIRLKSSSSVQSSGPTKPTAAMLPS